MAPAAAQPTEPMSRGEIIALIVAASCAGIMVTPFVIEIASPRDPEPVIAAQFVAAITGTTAFVMMFFYRRRARVRQALEAGQGLLARWTYGADEWQRFVATDPARRTRRRLRRIGLILGWGAAVVLVVIVYQLAATRWIALVLLGMFALCALIGGLGGRAERRRALGEKPTACIGPDGLLFQGELHVWNGWGNRLEHCVVESGCVCLTYSTPNKGQRPEVDVCLPIPLGKEAAALAVVSRLNGAVRSGARA